VRRALVSQRTASSTRFAPSCWNRIAVRQGIGFLRTELPTILCDAHRCLSPRMLRVIEEWQATGGRLDSGASMAYPARSKHWPSRSGMFAPDDGAWHRPIIRAPMVAANRHWRRILKGRDFGAWLGLGAQADLDGRPHDLGKISRRGNRYLRVLFVQGGMVVLVRIKNGNVTAQILDRSRKSGCTHNVLAIALANKLAASPGRCWSKGRAFELTRTDDAGVVRLA